MTTATRTTVDWVRLTLGGAEIPLSPSPGIELRLILDSVADSLSFDLLTPPGPPEVRVAVDLIPADGSAVAQCESWAARVATHLGANAAPLGDLKEFSLEAAISGGEHPYSRLVVPHLTLTPGPPPFLDKEESLPGVRVFTAKAHTGSDGSKYQLYRA
ncbi:hypothetical protein ABZ154_15755 [Streptomyces sp. NPDC006261]|uniref:hypothetical protein n=1 Tax=Streptomyces sp. NPDC006261 TaxID=3156739 RepID=UPI0033BC02D0